MLQIAQQIYQIMNIMSLSQRKSPLSGKLVNVAYKNRNKIYCSQTNHTKDESKKTIRNKKYRKISRNNPHEEICFFYIIKIKIKIDAYMVNNAMLIFLIILFTQK